MLLMCILNKFTLRLQWQWHLSPLQSPHYARRALCLHTLHTKAIGPRSHLHALHFHMNLWTITMLRVLSVVLISLSPCSSNHHLTLILRDHTLPKANSQRRRRGKRLDNHPEKNIRMDQSGQTSFGEETALIRRRAHGVLFYLIMVLRYYHHTIKPKIIGVAYCDTTNKTSFPHVRPKHEFPVSNEISIHKRSY